jgi:cytochrome oxidase Cu insertion factor (SCO1/SenC/PrrC family)
LSGLLSDGAVRYFGGFKELGPDKKIAALFVTVDPERDTPDILKTYLENFDSRIIGLTGDPSKTEAIAKVFAATQERCLAKSPTIIRWIIPGSSI